MELTKDFLVHAHDQIAKSLQRVDPLLLTSATMVSTYALVKLWNMHRDDIGIKQRLLTRFFTVVKRIPWIKAKIDREISKVKESLHHTLHEHDGDLPFLSQIPTDGIETSNLIRLVEDYSKLGVSTLIVLAESDP
ncbi:hypothetical protein COOONC_23246 [Cooperia oncophora]